MTRTITTLRSRLTWAAIAGALVLLIGLSPTALAQSQRSDATLSALTLSDVDFGTFASDTTTYTASVYRSVSETTVTPTVNHSGASYVIKLGGVEDSDGEVSLSVGSNVITVEVTAEDGDTTETYTVTVTRAENWRATGAPTISGTAQVGETLTVDTSGIADADGLTNVSYTYRWLADATDPTSSAHGLRVFAVAGEGVSYTISRNFSGMPILIEVSFTDDNGNQETLTSAKTGTVAPTTPAAPEDIEVSATALGYLRVAWDAPRWSRDGEIRGEQTWGDGGSDLTGYVVQWKEESGSWDTEDDVSEATETETTRYINITGLTGGTEYAVRVIAENSVGRGASSDEESATTNNLPTGAPTISGTAKVGQTLTADTSAIADVDGLDDVRYDGSWFANDPTDTSPQGGYILLYTSPGRDLRYQVSRRDVGRTIKIEVNFTDNAGITQWLPSAKTAIVTATTPAAPENFAASPTNSGNLDLSWEAPTWRLAGEIDEQPTWGDGGSAITGYVVQWKEASDDWETEADVSEATVTGTTHTIQNLTSGTEYTARVIAVNSVGRGAASDEASATANNPATGTPTISGTAQVGQALTASTTGISDSDGLTNVSYSYQWLADDTAIDGATSSTYTVQASDNGKVIKVQVTFDDDAGNDESLTSAGTSAVVLGGL